jgi:hypothetical protein
VTEQQLDAIKRLAARESTTLDFAAVKHIGPWVAGGSVHLTLYEKGTPPGDERPETVRAWYVVDSDGGVRRGLPLPHPIPGRWYLIDKEYLSEEKGGPDAPAYAGRPVSIGVPEMCGTRLWVGRRALAHNPKPGHYDTGPLSTDTSGTDWSVFNDATLLPQDVDPYAKEASWTWTPK